jgi:hypothetical protein
MLKLLVFYGIDVYAHLALIFSFSFSNFLMVH